MKTLHKAIVLIILSFSLLQTGCNRPIIGEGDLIKESRNIDYFNKISLNISAHVSIIVTDSNSVTLVGQQNIVNNIKLETNKKTLLIRSEHSLSTNKPIEILITCTTLEGIEINGSGKIVVINPYQAQKATFTINGSGDIEAKLKAAEIKSRINGSGDLYLSGEVKEHKVQINGSGDLKAEALSTSVYDININGSGSANILAKEKLDISIVGSGDVNYAGDPVIKSDITGKGKINSIKKEK